MQETVVIACDPLFSDYGPTRPAILIARELVKLGHFVKILSVTVAQNIRKRIESMNIPIIDLGKKFHFKDESIAWFESWLSEALFSLNSKHVHNLSGIVLNFSNTIAIPSKAWYAQGPPTVTLNNIKAFLPWHYKMTYGIVAPVLTYVDKKSTKRLARTSEKLIVNSKYLANIYRNFDAKIYGVIYPPLDCEDFRPITSRPSEDYVLTYFGKETKFPVVTKVADTGIKLKFFGGKLTKAPRVFLDHPNIEVLGRVSNEELVKLYSNALFTLYPFTDEPFGYIPIESMACGTPVLTFNRQGPSESVIDSFTGWLTNSDEEIVNLAIALWKNGYPSTMRQRCRKRALSFDAKNIAKRWSRLITHDEAYPLTSHVSYPKTI
jgi:glycosyltransferase involved in cell wall biosynthesis